MISRREAIVAGAMLAVSPWQALAAIDAIDRIEQRLGGRIGVAARDLNSGRKVEHRSNERFAMCSTFKASLAAAILRKVDAGEIALSDILKFETDDVLPNSPVTSIRRSIPALSVGVLLAAAVERSDNTAANLLLAKVGGPPALTAFWRSIGDPVTRLDRVEPALNNNMPGDNRDTTTPIAMVRNLRAFLIGDRALSRIARGQLTQWMLNEQNGRSRIRAGVPSTWRVANKPGTGQNGAVNDIAVVWPPGRRPIILSIYSSAPGATTSDSERAIADMTRYILRYFDL